MRRLTRSLLSLALCLPAVAVAQSVSAFTHVTLIDGRDGPALPDMTVIVRRQRIESVSPSASTVITKARSKTYTAGLGGPLNNLLPLPVAAVVIGSGLA